MRKDFQEKIDLFIHSYLTNRDNQDWFYDFIDVLIKEGWLRGDIHMFILNILSRCAKLFALETENMINELESRLTGFCNPSCIFRFEGDPEDEEILAHFVRSNVWKLKDSVIIPKDDPSLQETYLELEKLINRIGNAYDGLISTIHINQFEEIEISILATDSENNRSWCTVEFTLSKIVEFKIFQRKNYSRIVLSPYGIQIFYHKPYIFLDFAPIEDIPVKLENTLQSPLYICCQSVEWKIKPYHQN